MTRELDAIINDLAAARVLLVASDFDGVLAPIVDRPDDARIDPAADRALQRLAALPRTHAAVISGRALADLDKRVPESPGILLVGSHGAEPASGRRVDPTPEQRNALDQLEHDLRAIAEGIPGALHERKPYSVALHYRCCRPAEARDAFQRALAHAARFPFLIRRDGHMVVEFAALPLNKGHALLGIMLRAGASAVLFLGDDATDEDAFPFADQHGLAVRVGDGPTSAAARVQDQPAAVALLEHLAERREAHLRLEPPTPIETHSILSDQRAIAVMDPRADLVWLALPRADSTAVFSSLLGDVSRGCFSITPTDEAEYPVQEYLGPTMILRTKWRRMTVTDYFDCSAGRAYQRAGRSDLIRRIEGEGTARVRFAPRLDFGRVATSLVLHNGGLEVDGSDDPFVLFAPGVSWRIEQDGPHHAAIADIDLSQGPIILEMRYGFGSLGHARTTESERFAATERFWAGWGKTLRLPSRATELVLRSALTLKALCHGPTGAILAAATTSLPEHLGGSRNWDYRYCWPRDACLAAAALMRLGNTGVAMKLLDWLVAVVDRCDAPERLRPLYSVAGTELSPEAEIGDLSGYDHSKPVRVGNAADRQVQLDVFGPIVDLAARLVENGAPVTPEHWRLVEAMVAAVAARWNEPDHGIWEVRGPKAHHVHTKIMCWHAVDRAIAISRDALGRNRPDWAALRDLIRDDILTQGWSSRAGAFTFRYGSDDLDAATLLIGTTGLLPPNDPRFIATVRAVQQSLLDGPVVYRYRLDDGLPGIEGGFHLCTSWLIEALLLIGERASAERLFEQLCALAGPTGLLAEQYDPRKRMALGNFPQAYSHLGLINAAVAVSG